MASNLRVDYTARILGPRGTPTTLPPLLKVVVAQALADHDYLAYETQGDLGGFLPAPIGHMATSGGGRAIVGSRSTPQVPHYAAAADGRINSFAFIGSATPPATPPDNGRQPLPSIGVPPQSPAPRAGTTVPPPNQGFGGNPTTEVATTSPATTTQTPPTRTTTPPPAGTTATTTTETTTATTTTTTTTAATTTVATTTVVATTTGTTTATSGGRSCGTTGLTITSDHSTCVIYATNMAPGGSASELMTVRNDTSQPFTLSLKATGTQNTFWNDLQLGVWKANSAAPSPLPRLLYWTTGYFTLDTLQPGQSIAYKVELYLPASAGNSDQGKTAVINLSWRAQA